VGEGAVRSIIAAREAEGPFTSMFDLLCRIDLRLCNKRVLEALICAGALDGFAPESGRAQLMEGLEATFNAAQAVQRDRESSQGGLFDVFGDGGGPGHPLIQEPPLPRVEKWSEAERLKREREILGFFISGHPLDKHIELMSLFDRVNTANLKEHRDGKVELPCVVTEVSRQISKKDGSEWGRITVEDFYGTATVLSFGETWAAQKDSLVKDAPVLLYGAVSGRERDEEDPPLFLDRVVPLAGLRESGEVGLCIELTSEGCDAERLERARTVLSGHPGPAPLIVLWRNGGGEGHDTPRLRSRSLRIAPREELVRDLRDVLGEERVRLVRA
jgi:DNA polymerase III subunit alpha